MTVMQETEQYIRASDLLPYIPTYTENNITPDGKFLNIELNNQSFPLELRNVGNTEHPAYIAWMDTHPDHPHVPVGLPHAAAVERAQLLVKMANYYRKDVRAIVTASSTKSIPSIQEAVQIASKLMGHEVHLVILLGGSEKDKDELAKRSALPLVSYTNITSQGKEKYVGITKDNLDLLRKLHIEGKEIWEMDDIHTTGGTTGGVQKTVDEALGLPITFRRPLIVVARESPYDDLYPHKAPDNVFALRHLPEFVGQMPAILQKG